MPQYALALVTFFGAFLVAALATPLVIRLGRLGLALDRPNDRKHHAGAIPRLGGVAVLAGSIAGVGLALWSSGYQGTLLSAVRFHWIGWIGAIALLFLCGIVDDLRPLGAAPKLAVQVVAGLAVFLAGFRIEHIRLPGMETFALGVLALPVTLLWIVGVTNAINFLDGLDGLAAGTGFLITATVAAISFYIGVFPVTILALALAGSLLGFLPWNFSPARIFLGDSGSQFLGFTLAVISIRGLHKSATFVAILVPILVLGLPILDTLLVVARRTWRIRGESHGAPEGLRERVARTGGLFRADREHIHHNLLELGLSHRKAVVLLYMASAAFCAAAFALVALRDPTLALLLAACVALATAFVKILAVRRRTYAPPRILVTLPGARPGTADLGESGIAGERPPALGSAAGADRC